MSSNRFRSLVLLLFLGALAVRLFRPSWDDGHWFHPDERRIAEAVQELKLSPLQLNPKFFAYGSFPFYLTRIAQGAVGIVRPSLGDYAGTIYTGRALSALWGALTVVLLAFLGRKLYGERVGLLAAAFLAAAVLHLQNSHFATPDVALTLLVLFALTLLVRANDSGSARDTLLGGFAIGLAVATKVSALPLFLPLVVAVFAGRRERRLVRNIGLVCLAAACAAAGFFLGEPYALLDFRAFSHDVVEQSQMVRNAGWLVYTTQYLGTPKVLYDIREHVLWGLGPLLGMAALWGAWRTYRVRSRAVTGGEWVLLSFALGLFAITASFEVKFLRYLLPLYPLLCLWAARWLTEGTEATAPRPVRLRKRVLLGAVLGATGLYAAAFLTVYTRPHTIVTASRWFYANVPKGSEVLSQDWDEGFPFDVDGHFASEYRVTNFSFYEDDSDEKIRRLAGDLARSEMIVFQTKRLTGAITRAPDRFPRTNRFFRSLFAGDLGFRLEKEVASRPGLFGFTVPDELADESFSVYDHPKAVLFRNEGHLAAADMEDRILRGAPSRPMTREEILLAPASFGNDERPGRSVRSSVGGLLVLALFAQLLGIAGYLILRRFLAARPGLYALGKIAGPLFFSFAAWLLVAVGAVPFTRHVLLVLAAAVVVAAMLPVRRPPGFLPAREIVWTEGIVWASFLFFALARAWNPEIFWGEKPMDFSFLNLLYRTVSLPPVEPWFAGTPLSYAYFGHFTLAAIGKTLAIQPALMFNLGVALTAALTAAGFFAAGAVLGKGLGTGLLATLLGLTAGNLSGIREVLARKAVNFDTFWATSRVIPDTINEYPFWSFLFADLHAHLLELPFALGFVALLLLAGRSLLTPEAGQEKERVPLVVLGALFLGAAAVTNGWSVPVWATLSLVVLCVASVGRGWRVLTAVLAAWAACVAGSLLLYRPFWTAFVAPQRQVGWEVGPFAAPRDVFLHFGLFFAILVPFLLLVLWRALAPQPGRTRLAAVGLFALVAVALATTLLAWTGGQPAPRVAPSIRNFAALLSLVGFFAAFHPRTDARHRLPAALSGFAFGVIACCEAVTVWDRMNTVFKFYFDTWLVLSLSSALVVRDLLAGLFCGRTGRLVWKTFLVAGAAASVFTSAVAMTGLLRTDRVSGPRGTLDGTRYLEAADPDGSALYAWLGKSVSGLPAIAEAWGPSYQDFTRVCMNSGLPTVLGWDYHLTQRGKSWAAIDQRKEDLRTLYTARTPEQAAAVLRRYQVRYVVSGPIERRAYLGEKSPSFDSFDGLLKPVFQKGGTTLYEVSRSWRPPSDAVPAAVVPALPTPAGEESPGRTGR